MKTSFGILITLILLSATQSLFAQAETKTVYPLVISFHSQCCGVPSDSAIRKFITSFKKKYKIKKIVAQHIGPLGREGEFDLAFKLNELSKKQKTYFLSKIKKVEKFSTDKGSFTFEEKKEIDLSELPGRTRTNEIVF